MIPTEYLLSVLSFTTPSDFNIDTDLCQLGTGDQPRLHVLPVINYVSR